MGLCLAHKNYTPSTYLETCRIPCGIRFIWVWFNIFLSQGSFIYCIKGKGPQFWELWFCVCKIFLSHSVHFARIMLLPLHESRNSSCRSSNCRQWALTYLVMLILTFSYPKSHPHCMQNSLIKTLPPGIGNMDHIQKVPTCMKKFLNKDVSDWHGDML